jgi:hypothetical protein
MVLERKTERLSWCQSPAISSEIIVFTDVDDTYEIEPAPDERGDDEPGNHLKEVSLVLTWRGKLIERTPPHKPNA